MTTHIMSMTYGPKIAGVMDGCIRQTIRRTGKFHVGDKLIIHTWTGKPYRSPWGQRMNAVIKEIIKIECYDEYYEEADWICPWNGPRATALATLDGIDPPTGPALKEVLEKFHGKFHGNDPDKAAWFQVIRW